MEPESKKQKVEEKNVLARFKSDTGEQTGSLFDLPINVSVEQLTSICNDLLEQEEPVPFTFFVNDKEIVKSLDGVLDTSGFSSEDVVEIIYQQQAVFKVRAVTRCTSSMPGHAEAVISVKFSPNSCYLASGSGDTTVRFWDLNTQTPQFKCEGHKNWVLCISWSPDSKRLVSGCKNGVLLLWDPETGSQCGPVMSGHKQWITAITWEPFHTNSECRYFASSSKDGDIRVWDSRVGKCQRILTSHSKSVTCLQWGGSGLLYSGSQDRTIKVWRAQDGVLCRTLEGHGHWVNSLTLNTDYILRMGSALRRTDNVHPNDSAAVQKLALSRYEEVCKKDGEILVSGSDDFTLFMWKPESSKKSYGKELVFITSHRIESVSGVPIFSATCVHNDMGTPETGLLRSNNRRVKTYTIEARLTGHQQLINDVKFSPDSRILASASFDKSVRLWEGKTGKFITTLRGHVQAVYMVAWSADSRLLVTASADSTLKVWTMKTKKLLHDLPGHSDEVFAVDWSVDGEKVASGGKDKLLKIWQN